IRPVSSGNRPHESNTLRTIQRAITLYVISIRPPHRDQHGDEIDDAQDGAATAPGQANDVVPAQRPQQRVTPAGRSQPRGHGISQAFANLIRAKPGCHAFGEPITESKLIASHPESMLACKGRMLSGWQVSEYCAGSRSPKAWHPANPRH